MATYEVSTWTEIISKISECIHATTENKWNNTVIKVTQGIDLNYEFPLGTASTFNGLVGSQATGTLTIDGSTSTPGENTVIRNLRTSVESPAPIITIDVREDLIVANLKIKFKNIDFTNIILANSHFFRMTGTTGFYNNTSGIIFENCRFVGSRSGSAHLAETGAHGQTYCLLTSCYFNIPWQGAGSSSTQYVSLVPQVTSNTAGDYNTTANYCWFRENYTGWTVPNRDYQDMVSDNFTFSYIKCSGCYVDGTVKLGRLTIAGTPVAERMRMSPNGLVNNFTPSTQNVIDCDIETQGGQLFVGNWSGVIKKDARNNGTFYQATFQFSEYAGVNNKYKPIFATIAQMKDAAALKNLGFDIIVPDTN